MAKPDKDRAERLAAALRENLRKRKAQARILPGTGRGTTAQSGVVEGQACQADSPLHHPTDGPPPRPGED